GRYRAGLVANRSKRLRLGISIQYRFDRCQRHRAHHDDSCYPRHDRRRRSASLDTSPHRRRKQRCPNHAQNGRFINGRISGGSSPRDTWYLPQRSSQFSMRRCITQRLQSKTTSLRPKPAKAIPPWPFPLAISATKRPRPPPRCSTMVKPSIPPPPLSKTPKLTQWILQFPKASVMKN